MTERLSGKGQLLKLKLAAALQLSWSGAPLSQNPQWTSPTVIQEIEKQVNQQKRRTNNGILVQLFAMGLAFGFSPQMPNPSDYHHVAALFLREYFKGEEQAIPYLEDVSVWGINRVSAAERRIIIGDQPNHPPPAPSPLSCTLEIVGHDSINPGEMWQNSPESPFFLPESPFVLQQPSGPSLETEENFDGIFSPPLFINQPSDDNEGHPCRLLLQNGTPHVTVTADPDRHRPLKRTRQNSLSSPSLELSVRI
jgi:hypothetical protein